MTDILPLDVAVCDEDLLWRVEHMNALHSLNVRDFAEIADAIRALTPGHESVIVVGRSRADELLAALPTLVAGHPEWPALVVLDHEDAQLAAQLTAAGAQIVLDRHGPHRLEAHVAGLLTERMTARTEREDAVESERERAAEASGRIVVVTSAKGGEGVTLLALNLAMAFAEVAGERVTLLEGDAQFGDVSLLLHLPGRPQLAFDRLQFDAETLERLSVQHPETGMRIVRPPHDPTAPQMPGRVARAMVRAAARESTLVVVDAPFDLVRSSRIASIAAATLLVTSSHTTSVKNTMVALRDLLPHEHSHIVINNVSRHHGHAQARRIADASHEDVIAVLPFEPKLGESMETLTPRVLRSSRTPYGRACRELAQQLRRDVLTTVRLATDGGVEP